MKKINQRFPFDLMKLPTGDNNYKIEPFSEKVSVALGTDLQNKESFGCRINNCHTHAGSKIHFGSFVEAELLFHNSYYNDRFADLTCNYLINSYSNHEVKNILLIGYESYSELFLASLRNKIRNRNFECDYCVYETLTKTKGEERVDDTKIRNLYYKEGEIKVDRGGLSTKFPNKFSTLCLFIVPINTSLSTMDKMVAKFYETINFNSYNIRLDYLCLITLYSENVNEFYDISETNNLKVKDKFERIPKGKEIKNLVLHKSDASLVYKCKDCFPSLRSYKLTEESPMFGVNRGSVVPMLKLGNIDDLEPINSNGESEIKQNLEKVFRLSEFMEYRHIVRGENHFQFYFRTARFLEKEENNIKDKELYLWLRTVGKKLSPRDSDKQVFDYLVAPRHPTNPQFVYLVNKYVFNESARIMFFDVNKEYRSNLVAKYSDFITALENIKSSGVNYKIRFHFVDDIINSGSAFLNAKNLISSLTSEINIPQENVFLFFSGILLVNRISKNRQNYYIDEDKNIPPKGFYYFVNVNISPMRNHEDACTLCKLGFDYSKIRKYCATNTLADTCSDIINDHKQRLLDELYDNQYNQNSDYNKLEKQYLFFITHLINERINNKFYFGLNNLGEPQYAIDSEKDFNDIKKILKAYYEFDNVSEKAQYLRIGNETEFHSNKLIWKIAFIKAVSRPFFTYHLRYCQAAFSFCLDKLDEILNMNVRYEKACLEDLMEVQTLVKALADMNANYIIRQNILNKLILWAKKGDAIFKEYIEKKDKYIQKRIFTSESLLQYVKKDLVLSRDTTKSLLLEHILLENKEDGFFATKTGDESEDKKAETRVVDDFIEDDGQIGSKGKLYLENNLILRKTLQDDIKKLVDDKSHDIDKLYFFENFSKVWQLNTGKKLSESKKKGKEKGIFDAYEEILKCLDDAIKYKKMTKDFSKDINNLFEKLGVGEIKAQAFLFDKNENNELFQFFTIAEEPYKSGVEFKDTSGEYKTDDCKFNGLLSSQAFFYDDNLEKIRSKIKPKDKKEDIFFIDNVLSDNFGIEGQSPKSLIVRFSIDEDISVNNHTNKEEEEKATTQDNSIYFQIWGFNKKEPLHWFALKLLLTLRNNFVRLIENINLQELIEERKVQMQKTALSIVKAVTHSSSNQFISYNICECKPGKRSRANYKEALKETDNANIVFDKYFHVIGNEYISSLFRKVVKNEPCLFQHEQYEVDQAIDQMLKGISQDGKLLLIDRLFVFGDGIESRASVKITYRRDNKIDSGNEIFLWSKLDGAISSLAHVLYLFAVNAAKYGKKSDNEVEFQININDNGITFSNQYLGNEVEGEKKLREYTKIPPWVFKREEQHITLWTLLQMNNKREENNYIYIEPSYGDGSYKIEILFNKEVRDKGA